PTPHLHPLSLHDALPIYDALNTSLRVEHMLTHTQMLRSEFQRSHTTADNLGVGDFDLPERAYSQTRDENVFRASLSGSMRKSLLDRKSTRLNSSHLVISY